MHDMSADGFASFLQPVNASALSMAESMPATPTTRINQSQWGRGEVN